MAEQKLPKLLTSAVFCPSIEQNTATNRRLVSNAWVLASKQIGPMRGWNRAPGLTNTRKDRAMADCNVGAQAPSEQGGPYLPLSTSFLVERRKEWFANDDGTTKSLPAILSHQIYPNEIDESGRLNFKPWDYPHTPLSLAYLLHAMETVGCEFDEAPKPIKIEWPAPATEARPASAPSRLTGLADLYFIGSAGGPIKIGVSNNPTGRLRSLQTGYPFRLEILATIPEGALMERAYHDRFVRHRLHGEWFARCAEIEAEIARLNGSPA